MVGEKSSTAWPDMRGKSVLMRTTVLLLGLLGIIGFYGTAAFAASSLPGGASSLQETYEDWRVNCVSEEEGASCLLVQRQMTRDTGQLLLSVELTTTASGELSGVIALPLGLRLDAGVTLQVDDGELAGPLPFSTCLPQGCLVPIAPDETVRTALREGETLKLAARLLDGRTINFSVSLDGFAAAEDRLQNLMASM